MSGPGVGRPPGGSGRQRLGGSAGRRRQPQVLGARSPAASTLPRSAPTAQGRRPRHAPAPPDHRLARPPGEQTEKDPSRDHHPGPPARAAVCSSFLATAVSLIDRPLIALRILGGADYLTAAAANGDQYGCRRLLPGGTGFDSALPSPPGDVPRRRTVCPPAWPSRVRRAGRSAHRRNLLPLIGALGTLLVVSLAHQVGAVGRTAAATAAGSWGQVLLDLRDRCSQIGILAFYVGGTLYYPRLPAAPPGPTVALGVGLASTGLASPPPLLVFCGTSACSRRRCGSRRTCRSSSTRSSWRSGCSPSGSPSQPPAAAGRSAICGDRGRGRVGPGEPDDRPDDDDGSRGPPVRAHPRFSRLCSARCAPNARVR